MPALIPDIAQRNFRDFFCMLNNLITIIYNLMTNT
jgi:hypothetical protein